MDDSKAMEAAEYAVIGKLEEWEPSEPSALVIVQAAIAAYLAQREADGFVMVPVEPTAAMLQAGDMGLSDAGVDNSTTEDAAWCWSAMIAARPKG